MSYAAAAAKGPKQSDEEIEHEDTGAPAVEIGGASLEASQSESSTGFSSYADQQLEVERRQEREAEREAEEAKKAAKETADNVSKDAKEFASKADAEAGKLKDQASKKASELKKEAGIEKDKAKKEAKKAGEWADRNKENPVVIGNGIALLALGGLLGFGAYRKHVAGELTWRLAATWAGAVGLFAVGDYYVSQFFFKKYPAK